MWDPTSDLDAKIIGPGAPFEIVTEEVLGERLEVIKNRPRSLREYLEASTTHGETEYIVNGERRITYDDHLATVGSVAKALQERYGVGPGDRVAILAENHPEWIYTLWATLSLGGVVASLNGWWARDEILHGLENSDPKVLVGDHKRLARLEGAGGVPTVEIESGFAALSEHAPGAPLPDVPIDEDDPAVILYTSGTTGRAKGAVNTHRGIIGFLQLNMMNGMRRMLHATDSGKTIEAPPPTCNLMTSPLFHLSGLFAGAIVNLTLGAKTVYRLGRFDAEDVLRLIEKEKVTAWSALGSMAHQVVSHPKVGDYDLSSIQFVGSGGAPTSPEIQRRLREVFPRGGENMALGYGSSESVAVISSIGGAELKRYPESTGPINATTQVEIRDADENVLPDGREGEIHVRSAYVMREYWRNPDATAKAIKPGRWLATGDIGRIEDGRLYINSRARDMILRSAENIYPVEIEHRLDEHPSVVESAVVGVDHPELGQEVKAILVTLPGADIDTDELARFVAEKLAAFKVPAHWEIRSEPLPRNAAGKVLKNVLTGEADDALVAD